MVATPELLATRVGAAPKSDPRGGNVTIAGISIAGRGAAAEIPVSARMEKMRTMAASGKNEAKYGNEVYRLKLHPRVFMVSIEFPVYTEDV
jgi:hypothetical protein